MGGRLTFRLAAYADVRFRLARLARGRRARPVRVRYPVVRMLYSGRRRVALPSLLGTRQLAPGRYRVTAVTRGAPPVRAEFRVVR
jgi:hypothetical protein